MIEYNVNANGGTEITAKKLESLLPDYLLNKFQIVCDTFNKLDKTKIRILWVHNTPLQIDNSFLENDGWKLFHKIVFISHYQREQYIQKYNIPYSHCVVISYGIDLIKSQPKVKDKISLIYTSTPHRGLYILVDVFEKLCDEYDNLELKIHSSYEIYDRVEQQKDYEQSLLFKRIQSNTKIKNLGFVSNEDLKKSLASSHIFAYPSIYEETFCLSLLEAMGAGLLCVHPNYGCLSETASKWTVMYNYTENLNDHKKLFYEHLKYCIENVNKSHISKKLKYQKKYVNYFYNWKNKICDWINLLKSMENLSPNKTINKIEFKYQ